MTFQLDQWIRPIYELKDQSDGLHPIAFRGTGFIFPGGLMVTCRHCVDPLPSEPNFLAGVIEIGPGQYVAEKMHDLCFEEKGIDMAAAKVATSDSGLILGIRSPGIGQDVGTFGYAGTYGRLPAGKIFGELSFDQQSRWLEGYVTRAFNYELPSGEVRPSWEIDMPTPGGLSGSPLIQLRGPVPAGRGVVIGMCYGRYLALGEPDMSGIPMPGYVFGLAHYYQSLADARFNILEQQTLGEFLTERDAVLDMTNY
ncbi:serine protease [Streptomyces sp. NPDC102256]|uniref:S1 family peptidase n=1 Tax=Streptomyces sp. NPDC102256 TaxID=3366147 RepID=UPI0038112535